MKREREKEGVREERGERGRNGEMERRERDSCSVAYRGGQHGGDPTHPPGINNRAGRLF